MQSASDTPSSHSRRGWRSPRRREAATAWPSRPRSGAHRGQKSVAKERVRAAAGAPARNHERHATRRIATLCALLETDISTVNDSDQLLAFLSKSRELLQNNEQSFIKGYVLAFNNVAMEGREQGSDDTRIRNQLHKLVEGKFTKFYEMLRVALRTQEIIRAVG